MKELTGNQIRQMFLDYFASKGHMIEPGASLVPHNDPTLLWINAGVAALKKYFDGSEKPKNNRIANAQKSIRQECYTLLPDHYNWDHCIPFQTCTFLSAHSTVPLTTDAPSYNFTIGSAHFSDKCRIGYDLFNFLPCICIAGAVPSSNSALSALPAS